MRKTMRMLAVVMLAVPAACGDDAVDETGTADAEIFTDSPDTAGVPVAGQGGTPADSAAMGGAGVGGTGATAGTGAEGHGGAAAQPTTTTP